MAFAKHGYADLSMSKIAEEFDKSQSLIHYHYDSKEGLMEAYMEYTNRYTKEVFRSLDEDPEVRLNQLLDILLFESEGLDENQVSSFLELYSQADHSESMRDKLREVEETMLSEVEETVRKGVEKGVFADVDPRMVAESVLASHSHVGVYASIDKETNIREALEEFVLSELYTQNKRGEK